MIDVYTKSLVYSRIMYHSMFMFGCVFPTIMFAPFMTLLNKNEDKKT